MREDELYRSQVALRRQLLDRRDAISQTCTRDLAAQMLLHIDDLDNVWRIGMDWLRSAIGVERADGGYASPSDPIYQPGQYESRETDYAITSLSRVRVNNAVAAARTIWGSDKPIVFASVAHEAAFGERLSRDLSNTGASSKMAAALRLKNRPFALVCVDRVGPRERAWSATQFDLFHSATAEVMSPILGTVRDVGTGSAAKERDVAFNVLTPAERRVAQLAAEGLCYKEIARRLDRSVHTVDHQLRSIRNKLCASSHAKLVQQLNNARH